MVIRQSVDYTNIIFCYNFYLKLFAFLSGCMVPHSCEVQVDPVGVVDTQSHVLTVHVYFTKNPSACFMSCFGFDVIQVILDK